MLPNEETKESKLIAIYGRVSSSNQENEGTVETQLFVVREFAQKNNYIVVKEYIDEGWSGDSLERPALDQLRTDAQKKIWQAVLLYDPDRLARRYSYQELVSDELRERGIEVIYVTTPAPQNGIEKILFGVQGLFAEYERAKISERFRIGKIRKAKEGNIMVSEPAYGYTFIPKKGKKGEDNFHNGYYMINEAEAKIVKMIYSWVGNENYTLNKVVLQLQALDIKPRRSKRGVWNKSTLGHMLRNKTYIGEGHYCKTYATIPTNPIKTEGYKKIKKSSRKIKPENEWIIIPTPKLIEPELFNKVANRLKINYESSKRNRKNEYLLAGKIYCICGTRRVGEGSKSTAHFYYRCTDRTLQFPLPRKCKEGGINVKVADVVVWNTLVELLTSKELLEKQIKRWKEKVNQKTSVSEIDRKETISTLAKLKEQEQRFVKVYGEGLITIEQFKQYVNPVKDKIVAQEKTLQELNLQESSPTNISLPSTEQLNVFTERITSILKNIDYTQKKLITDIIITEAKGTPQQLLVKGYIPINYLENVLFQTSYRHRQDTIRYNENLRARIEQEIPFNFSVTITSGKRFKSNS